MQHSNTDSCILLKFYIKPQPETTINNRRKLYLIKILHQTTTSTYLIYSYYLLYLIEILHQTTTSGLILIDKVLLTGCLPL